MNYTATPFIENLAKPKYPHDLVERYPKPRDLDEYGSPIFPKIVRDVLIEFSNFIYTYSIFFIVTIIE